MKKIVLLMSVLVLTAILNSCGGVGTFVAYFDSDIDSDILEDVRKVDDELINGLYKGDYAAIERHISYALMNKEKDISGFVSQTSEYIQGFERKPIKSIYVKTKGVGEHHPHVMEDLTDEEGMIYSLSGFSKEMYVSLTKIYDQKGAYLLYIEYTKLKGSWKVYRITLDELSFFDMDAVGLYNKAKELYNNGNDIGAVIYAQLYSACARPSDYIQYSNEVQMQNFFEKLSNELQEKYTFPISLSDNEGKEIYGLDVRVVNQGIVPVINYITASELSKANAETLQEEAYKIHEEIKSVWPGFDDSFDYFLYTAYNDYPIDANKLYYSYSSIVEKGEQY